MDRHQQPFIIFFNHPPNQPSINVSSSSFLKGFEEYAGPVVQLLHT
jgi:hypothetical protein